MEEKREYAFDERKPALTADLQKQPVIVQKLDVRPVSRRNIDIANWRRAIQHAELKGGSRVNLYNIYEDVLLDGHLISVVEKRLLAVANADWVFETKDGKEVDFITEWIDTIHFETLVKEIANSRLWGYSMLEFDFYKVDGPGIFLIPRKHMRPELGGICMRETGWEIESIRQGKFVNRVLEVGREKDLGLLMSAAQYAIYKRGNIGDWAQFIEIFGQPLVDAVWDGFDETQRQQLLQMINEMGGGGALVRPAGTELNIIDGTKSNQSGDLYDKFLNALNGEISKIILGQTETTESSKSSGYAQAEQHSETEDDINKSDRTFVRRILNSRVIRIFEANGYDLKGGRFKIADEGEERISKKDKCEIDLRIKGAGTPISDDYFYDKYGIEKPDNYDELKEEMKQRNEQPYDYMQSPFRERESFLTRLRNFF